jgi:hypothetical protein
MKSTAKDTQKTQLVFLNEVKVLSGDLPWNDIAKAMGISKRSLINYRLPERSINYRTMNDPTLRKVFNYVNALIRNPDNEMIADENIEENIVSVNQKDLFTEIKSLTGDPTWNELALSLGINKITFTNYILPENSSNYRKLKPFTLVEILDLREKLIQKSNEGITVEERWDSIKNGAFEKPDMNIDLSKHTKKAQAAIDKKNQAEKNLKLKEKLEKVKEKVQKSKAKK